MYDGIVEQEYLASLQWQWNAAAVQIGRKKTFEVHTYGKTYLFPYAVVHPTATPENRIIDTYVDAELDHEGFVYVLASGEEGTVHIDHVLEYNKDHSYMADLLLYKLTLGAQEAVKQSPLSTREIIRRLGTSPTQYYRLLDQTNYKKSVRQLITLLHIVNCEVEVVLKGPWIPCTQEASPVSVFETSDPVLTQG